MRKNTPERLLLDGVEEEECKNNVPLGFGQDCNCNCNYQY